MSAGKIGITLIMEWSEPKDPQNTEDVETSDRVMQFNSGWWMNPVFGIYNLA